MLAIETTGLTKRFSRTAGFKDLIPFLKRSETTAVNDVTISINEGELFGLLGPNGAGKTTLIKMLCCLVLPSSGTARIFSRDTQKEEQVVKNMLGLVNAEERSFYWRLTAQENLEFYASLYRIDRRQVKTRIKELLHLVGLEEFANVRFQTFSTGMKQKLAVARGLLSDPKILFVDEPTRSLDPVSAQSVRRFFREKIVSGGTTLILATHNLHEAEELCDRMAIMDRGKVRAIGSVGDLRARFQSQDKCELLLRNCPEDITSRLAGIPGVFEPRTEIRPDSLTGVMLVLANRHAVLPLIMQTVFESGAEICDFHLAELPLEEIFINALRPETITETA